MGALLLHFVDLYFLTIVDDYSCEVWLYLLPDREKVAPHLCVFFSMIEHHFPKLLNKTLDIMVCKRGKKDACLA